MEISVWLRHQHRMTIREIVLAVLVLGVAAENTRLKEVFSWKTVEFAFPKSSDREDAIKSKAFIPEHNLPLGLDVWRDKLFVTVPRWKSGVVSSLNFIDISDIDTSLDAEIEEEPAPLIEIGTEEEEEEEEGTNGDDEEIPEQGSEDEGSLDGVGDLLDEDGGLLEGVGDVVAGEDGLLDTVSDLTSPLISGNGNETGALDGVVETVGDVVAGEDGLLDTVSDLTSPLIGGNGNETGALDGVVETVGNLAEPVTDLLGGDDGLVAGVGDLIPGQPLDAVGDLAAPVTDLVGDVTDALPGPIGNVVAGVTNPLESLLGNDEDNNSNDGDYNLDEDDNEQPPDSPADEANNDEENSPDEVDVEESAVDDVDDPIGIATDVEESEELDEASEDDSEEDDSEEEEEEGLSMTRALATPPNRSLGSKKYSRVEGSVNKNCSENGQVSLNIEKRKLKSKKSKKTATLKATKKQDNGKATTNNTDTKSKTSKASQKKAQKSNINKNETFQENVSKKPQKNSKGKQATSTKTKKTSKKKADSAKNKKSSKVKDSNTKENNREKEVSKLEGKQDLMCRETDDNPCGIPIPDPIFSEIVLKPPKKIKNVKYEEAKKTKKKKKKSCKKKCRKPKEECVKPAKVSRTSPALIPYPNIETNTPAKDSKDSKITSVFRVRVDACDRLWVMDSGIADILGNTEVYSSPQILIYDLLTDKLVRKYVFKSDENQESSFFANIIVDAAKDKCENAFAYVPDLGSYAIVVYDFNNDKAWRIKHNYFHFNPLEGNYNVGGVNFQWTDGIFSLALTRPNADGSKSAYFHALSSYSQFKVNTFVLQNEGEAKSSNYSAYSLVGNKGADSQTSASFIHEPTGVMFYTQVNKNAIYCWNTDKPFNNENLEEIASDSKTMIFPNDLKVDYKNNLWVLTDKLPVFVKNGLDGSDVNYRIFVAPVSEAIKNTNCAP